MSGVSDNIVQPWEAESLVENLRTTDLEELGSKTWFEYHKKLVLLNQQSILEISTLREECTKEWFVTFRKIPVLIYEAIQIAVWKHKVFPLLVELNEEPTNTFVLYSVFYHETVALSLLENVLFHADSAETLDDSVLDLVDYAVDNVAALIYVKDEPEAALGDDTSCLKELLQKKREMEFDNGIKSISILRYLAEFADRLPLCVLSRMLKTHDVPYLLSQLIEKHPWMKTEDTDETMVYNNGVWEKMKPNEADKLTKIEGQVWIGLRELLLNPTSAPYYEITAFRIAELTKLQKYLQEHVLDQISPLIDLRRWLSYLSMSSKCSEPQLPGTVEVIPQTRETIMEKHKKRWKKLAKTQSKYLFTRDIEEIKNMAQVLSEAYDIDKLISGEENKCALCREPAFKRCSKCKGVWYCGRECQVKDWVNHKDICAQITNH